MTVDKNDKPSAENPNPPSKSMDKIWCPDGEHYQYVEGCEAGCKKSTRCQAYADYREPKFI